MTWTVPEVTRDEDAPLVGPDAPMLRALLAWHRATLLHKCAGLTPEQLATRAVPPSTLSLLGLVRHMAKVERGWFRRRVAGQQIPPVYDTAQRDVDFEDVDPATAEADYAQLLEEVRLSDEAVADLGLDTSFELRGATYSLRLVYLHMIGEYARHNGHADLIREVLDGVTGG